MSDSEVSGSEADDIEDSLAVGEIGVAMLDHTYVDSPPWAAHCLRFSGGVLRNVMVEHCKGLSDHVPVAVYVKPLRRGGPRMLLGVSRGGWLMATTSSGMRGLRCGALLRLLTHSMT